MESTAKKLSIKKKTIYKYLFVIAIICLPVTQFFIFYVGVNLNSVLLAFQTYSQNAEGQYEFIYNAGFSNFIQFATDIFRDETMVACVKNSAIQYVIGLVVSMPLAIAVSYFIWKDIPGAGVFKVVLMLPSIISSMVFVIIVKNLVMIGGPKLFNNDALSNIFRDNFYAILIYDLWIGFAGNLVLYLGAMSGVSVDVVEYGKIDGVNGWQELTHIVIPSIWPTITTFLVVGVAGFFTNAGSRYSFFEYPLQNCPRKNWTLGFYFFAYATESAQAGGSTLYPYFSAGGLLFTLVATPITLLARWGLEKFGPRED